MVRLFLLGALFGLAVGAFPGFGKPGAPNPSGVPFAPRRRPLPSAFVQNEYDAPADDGYDANAGAPRAEIQEPRGGGNEYSDEAPTEYESKATGNPASQQGEYDASPSEYDHAPAMRTESRDSSSLMENGMEGGNEDGEERFRENRNGNAANAMSALQTDQFVNSQNGQNGQSQQLLQRQLQQQVAQLQQLRAQQAQLERDASLQPPAKAAPQAPASSNDDPPMPTEAPSKLDMALMAVKDDIMKKSRQVEQEVNWIQQVKDITSSYQDKMGRVEDNVNALRDEVKDLYSKKKQIQNLQMQKKLKERLEDATQDLSTVTKALGHVQTKESEFQRTRDNIQATIYNIRTTLQQLAGAGVEGVEDDSDEKVENDIASEVKEEPPASDDLGGWTEELKAAKVESK